MGSVRAELLLLRRRPATWLLGAVAALLALFFTHVLPYATYSGDGGGEPSFVAAELEELVPAGFVGSVLQGFPFYLGMFTLILGVLAFGSEYGWDTFKTTLTFQTGRGRLVGAKLAAVAVVTLLYTCAAFAVAAAASAVIAGLESAALDWPSPWTIARGVAGGWVVLMLWALFGMALAVLLRSTPIAVGLGIVWGLVVEGLISGFGNDVAVLRDVAQGFLRTNGYSLLEPLGVATETGGGPGAFSGPFVDPWQAIAVIAVYAVGFAALATALLRRRDMA